MAEVWLLTLQIAMLAFIISTATAVLIYLVKVILGKLKSGKGDDRK